MNIKKLCIVDAHNIVMRSLFGRHGEKYYLKNEDVTGAVNAYQRVLTRAKVINTVPIVCFDSGPYEKVKDVSEFKKKKKDTSEEDKKARNLNIKVFEDLCALSGFIVWKIKGMEADDLIASAINKNDRCLIMSNDSDLHQLYGISKFITFDTTNGDFRFSDYSGKWKVPPADLCLYLAIVGTHNGLSGIKGMGPVSTMKLFSDDTLLSSFYDKHSVELERLLKAIELPWGGIRLKIPEKRTACIPELEALLDSCGMMLDVIDLEYIESMCAVNE